MRCLWILMLCATPVAAQNMDKTVEVQVQKAPQNPVKLLQTDQANGANIRGAKLSPDGKLLALYGVDSGNPNLPERKTRGVLQIWDLATRQKVRDLVGHNEWMQRVFWSHDGQKLVSQSQDGQILLWDALSGKQLFALTKTRELPSFGVPSTATPVQQVQQLISIFERPQLIGFAPDDSQIYALGGHVVLPAAIQKGLQDVLAGRTKPDAADTKPKTNINLPDYVVGSLQMWNARTGIAGAFQDFGAPSHYRLGGALSADGRNFLVSDMLLKDGALVVAKLEKRDLKSGALQFALDGGAVKDNKPNLFSLLSDDGRFALLSSSGEDNHSAQLWDIDAQKSRQVLADSQADFSRAIFVADNTKLLVGGRTGDILIFDLQNGQIERRLSGGHWGEIATLDLTPDGKTLISVGDQDSAVQLWDLTVAAGATLQSRALVRDANVRQIAPAPDGSFWIGYGTSDYEYKDSEGSRLITGESGKTLEVSHLSGEGEKLEKISLPEEFLVDNVTFSSDFKLAAASLGTQPQPAYLEGAGVGVWDLEHKKLLWHLPGNRYLSDVLAFAPDNQTLVVGHGDAVELWDLATGKLVRQLLKSPSSITALTFARDGKTLAIGNDGGTIQMLDVETGDVRAELTEDFSPRAIAFSPDGKYVLSGGNIAVEYNTVGFKVTLRDAENQKLLREWASDQGAPSAVEPLQRDDGDNGVRYFGGLSFSPDRKLIAFAHYGNPSRIDRAQTEIWSIAGNARVGLIPDRASAQSPTFSPDGKTLFTTDGGWIKSWNLAEVLAQNAKP